MESPNEKVKEYIRLYTEVNYPIRDIAKQCKTSYIQQVIWAKKYLPGKNEGFRDDIQQTKFKVRYKV
jgi:hypothetical protein